VAWKNGYYYENRRVGKKVISRYFGNGYTALLAEEINEQVRLDAAAKRQAWQAVKDEEARLDKIVEDVTAVSQQMVVALMLVTGHHSHKSQWRKIRERSRKSG